MIDCFVCHHCGKVCKSIGKFHRYHGDACPYINVSASEREAIFEKTGRPSLARYRTIRYKDYVQELRAKQNASSE